MDGRPNRRNKAAFLTSLGIVWAWRKWLTKMLLVVSKVKVVLNLAYN